MERRTKIVVSGIAVLVIGLPLLFFIQLARGFGSSGGDYYRIAQAETGLYSVDYRPGKDTALLLSRLQRIDSNTSTAFYIALKPEYYASNQTAGTGLYAALAPGRKGCKENIDSIGIYITDLKTHKRTDLSQQVRMPEGLALDAGAYNKSTYIEATVFDPQKRKVCLFKDLETLKAGFNASRGRLFDFMLENRPLLFFLEKGSLSRSGFSFHISMKLSDGQILRHAVSVGAEQDK